MCLMSKYYFCNIFHQETYQHQGLSEYDMRGELPVGGSFTPRSLKVSFRYVIDSYVASMEATWTTGINMTSGGIPDHDFHSL